jgi:hypothetical protein
MDARHRSIQVLGWLAIVAGYGFALVLIRGIFLGTTRGFGAVGSQALWILLGYLLSFALAVYLFILGQHAVSIAKGCPRPKARFGWGRMLLGAGWLFGTANAQFGLLPTRTLVKSVAYSNSTQVVAGKVTTIALSIGCVFLIFSGIRKDFRQQIVK